ncbi:MAG TPA: aminotransferase class I/II-fold pyridoxal phosphate-dependent enzyme [Bryobacteraceae bacterium]|nr:aminotransferase class I/II-fold pyridoxal phosphate-dependent enzyme [Bryobacteraceae bacterium]
MSNPERKIHPSTAVLTAGFDPALSVGSARPAVFRSSTYVFASPEAAERAFAIMGGRVRPEPGETADLVYSRFNHPNAEIVEAHILPLEEEGRAAAVFNSGMAAIMTAVMAHAKPGDAIVYTVPIYGGTQSLIQNFLEPWGMRGVPVPGGDRAAMERAISETPSCRIVLVESPANPTLTMTDIAHAVAAAARREPRPLVMVDNTFLGPAFQHPLALGADIALYSATKYLGGFSDILAGVAISRDPETMKPIRGRRSLFGNILAPDECWILDSRLPTLHLRMNKQSKNAQKIAERLAGHPAVERIYYPALFDDAEQARIRDAQCDYPGGLFSMNLRGGKSAAFEFLRRLKVARNAVSLGGVETLVCHPRSTTHSAVSQEELQLSGVVDGLVRVSVGIEDWRDLLADFENALRRAD